ncbi:hypothetical protein BcepF1.046 [Burkholderia phage BcepF1]|uniref:Uncharacterized protein n=1 Tax=Burkholderia phage BcepF1 TaxID=2886897 RepID=A1YZV0_9CAUD|nr:hypothetical protein BcepF1.046 [Burkholderia phage BcepF1]ABL96777.1 hypothetical protein BcepF1.046 [Burkholderia phage BcepF1]
MNEIEERVVCVPVLMFSLERELTVADRIRIEETGVSMEHNYTTTRADVVTKQVFYVYPSSKTSLALLVTVLQNVAAGA